MKKGNALTQNQPTKHSKIKPVQELCEKSRRLRLAGETSAALACARQAKEVAPDSFAASLTLARALSSAGENTAQTVDAWQACIEKFPAKVQPFWFRSLLTAKREIWGNLKHRPDSNLLEEEVISLHKQARELWPENPEESDPEIAVNSRRVTAWILRTRAQFITAAHPKTIVSLFENRRALAAWEEYFQVCGDVTTAPHYHSYLEALISSRPDDLEERISGLIARACERWPIDVQTGASSAEGAVFYLGLGKILLGQGRVESAIAELAKVSDGVVQSELARELEQIAQSVSMSDTYRELSASSQATTVQDDTLMIWENERGSDKIVYVFGGGGLRAFLMIASMHRSLKKQGCHIVYLVDRHSGFFLKSERWPKISALRDELLDLATQIGATKRYTLGISSGGYAALRLGLDLEADRILAFSPLVTPATNAFPATRKFFRSLCDDDANFIPNIDDYYQTRSALPPAIIVYGEGSDRDRQSAEQLEMFNSVQLRSVDGCNNHGSLKWLMERSEFDPFLDDLFADAT